MGFLCFGKKDKDPDHEEPRKVSLATLFRFTTTWEKGLLILGLIISAGTGAALPLISILQGNLSQAFINQQAVMTNSSNHPPGWTVKDFSDQVMQVVYQYAYLSVGTFLAACIQAGTLLIVSEHMMNRLRRNFMQAILKQEIAWFDKNSGGSLSTQLFDNLERVREGTGDKMGLAVQFCAQFITGFVIAFIYDWRLTLIMMAITPIQVICGYATARIMATFIHAEALKYGKAGKIAEEVISSIRTVVAFNGLERECARYNVALKDAREMGVRRCIYIGLSFGIMGMANFIAFAVAFYVGVGFVGDKSMDAGTLMTVFFAVMMGSTALGQAGPQIAVVGTAQGAAAAIFDVLDRTPEIESTSPEGVAGVKISGRITLENVKFRYPSRPDVPVLKGVSFTVEPGETVALVGSSGSGKSTIVSLLLRYYDVESGKFTLDGRPVSSYNLHFLRNVVGVVSQEPILFNCSIAENIRYGRTDVTDNEIKAACAVSNAAKFISALPHKYETLVGDRGTQLSGGQKQRIAIARALVRNPQILLLDEATSALDAESERTVQKALDKAAVGRTTIIIAHRLSTIRHADKIIAMRQGDIVEMGSHESLMLNKSLYYDLVTAQTFTDAADAATGDGEDEEDAFPVDVGLPANGHRPSVAEHGENSLQAYRHANRTMSNVSAYTIGGSRKSIRRRAGSNFDDIDTDPGGMRTRTLTTGAGPTPIITEAKKGGKKDDMKRLKEELKDAGAEPASIMKILLSSRQDWWRQAVGFVMVLIMACVTPCYSIIFTQIMDIFSLPHDQMETNGHLWALLFLALAIMQGVSLFGQVFFLGSAGERLTARLRARLFKNIVSHEIAYFDAPKHACGKICTRLATDVPHVRSAVDYRLGTIVVTVLSILMGVIVAFIFGWQMAFVTLAVFPIFGVGLIMRHRVQTGAGKLSAKDLEESGKIAMEAIEHIRTVQALTREELFHTKFCSSLDGIVADALKQAVVQGISYGFAVCAIFIMFAISYRVGVAFVEGGIMYPIPILRVLYAIALTTSMLGLATAYVPEFIKAKISGGIVYAMLDNKPVIDNMTDEGKRPTLGGNISFRNVRFCYPERPQIKVLQGLNLDIKVGQTVALVGASGCGKSTTIGLIERFYDVDSGHVLLDGIDIRECNPQHVRSQIALVSQEPTLFDCTIRENIIYGMDQSLPQAEVERAAKLANVHNFIASLPYGYETNVGERGTQLSGGQKQRIAIARALVRNPKILLLDEATSALDTESEKMVQEALDVAREGRTCLTIAHRLSSIINSDVIAVVQKGVIVEKGSHSELMALKGFYYNLNNKQVAPEKKGD